MTIPISGKVGSHVNYYEYLYCERVQRMCWCQRSRFWFLNIALMSFPFFLRPACNSWCDLLLECVCFNRATPPGPTTTAPLDALCLHVPTFLCFVLERCRDICGPALGRSELHTSVSKGDSWFKRPDKLDRDCIGLSSSLLSPSLLWNWSCDCLSTAGVRSEPR